VVIDFISTFRRRVAPVARGRIRGQLLFPLQRSRTSPMTDIKVVGSETRRTSPRGVSPFMKKVRIISGIYGGAEHYQPARRHTLTSRRGSPSLLASFSRRSPINGTAARGVHRQPLLSVVRVGKRPRCFHCFSLPATLRSFPISLAFSLTLFFLLLLLPPPPPPLTPLSLSLRSSFFGG
jgi:hypothetical protein